MNTQDIYIDGINHIYATGNMVRIELATLQPHLKAENGQPVFNVNHRLVMPLDAFVTAFGVQQNILQQLIQAGVVTLNPGEQPGQDESK